MPIPRADRKRQKIARARRQVQVIPEKVSPIEFYHGPPGAEIEFKIIKHTGAGVSSEGSAKVAIQYLWPGEARKLGLRPGTKYASIYTIYPHGEKKEGRLALEAEEILERKGVLHQGFGTAATDKLLARLKKTGAKAVVAWIQNPRVEKEAIRRGFVVLKKDKVGGVYGLKFKHPVSGKKWRKARKEEAVKTTR